MFCGYHGLLEYIVFALYLEPLKGRHWLNFVLYLYLKLIGGYSKIICIFRLFSKFQIAGASSIFDQSSKKFIFFLFRVRSKYKIMNSPLAKSWGSSDTLIFNHSISPDFLNKSLQTEFVNSKKYKILKKKSFPRKFLDL